LLRSLPAGRQVAHNDTSVHAIKGLKIAQWIWHY
jgi:hypothetical protein